MDKVLQVGIYDYGKMQRYMTAVAMLELSDKPRIFLDSHRASGVIERTLFVRPDSPPLHRRAIETIWPGPLSN